MREGSNHSRRHIPCLMKSCFPTAAPHHPQPISAADNRRPSLAAAAAATSIFSLPDDLLLECLSRLPSSSLPLLPLVCRRWSYLLSSSSSANDLSLRRRRLGLLRPTLFAFSVSHSRTLSAVHLRLRQHCDDDDDEIPTWKLAFLLPAQNDGADPDPGCLTHSRTAVAVGRQIYVLDHNVMLRYDVWTGNLVPKPPMVFPRKKFAAAVVAGKIYVAGGSARTGAVEEYDPETDEWRVMAHAPRRRYGCFGASVDGVLYIIGGLKLGASEFDALPRPFATVYTRSMDLYDLEAGGWLRSREVPGGGCVVAACSAGGYLYVLASHAVALSFWRFNARRKGGAFGEWHRIRVPQLLAQVRVAEGGSRFRCVGIAEDKVALVQGRRGRGLMDGWVLVYDGTAEEWRRAADLPEIVRRAACVCVEC